MPRTPRPPSSNKTNCAIGLRKTVLLSGSYAALHRKWEQNAPGRVNGATQ